MESPGVPITMLIMLPTYSAFIFWVQLGPLTFSNGFDITNSTCKNKSVAQRNSIMLVLE